MSLAGFVGYRDHCDEDRFVEIPLTSDIAKVSNQLQPVSAFGGGDVPEDVSYDSGNIESRRSALLSNTLFVSHPASCGLIPVSALPS